MEMTESEIEIKVCGLNTSESVATASRSGASHIGFIFYPPSPRAVTPERAGKIASAADASVNRVAVLVDPTNTKIEAVITSLSPSTLQLHGKENPERVAEVKRLFGLRVIKAVRVSTPNDIREALAFDEIADSLLFDAKPPKNTAGMLPGGNGLAFDWTLLRKFQGRLPWFLSGGLNINNVDEALKISGARAVDISSGVEDRPGVKNLEKINAFTNAVQALKSR